MDGLSDEMLLAALGAGNTEAAAAFVYRPHRSVRYTVELATTSGRRVALPSLQLDPRTGSAGQAIPVDLRTVASVRLVGPRGDVLEAQVPQARTGTR